MISRQWRGLANPSAADAYVEHLQKDTIPQLRKIAGFIDVSILKRPLKQGIEFLVVTRWQSMDSIREFAGTNPESAVVPENVKKMMVEYDHRVRHFEVVV